MSGAPRRDELDDILHALRHADVSVRERAIQRLQTYSFSVTDEAALETLTKSQAMEALDRDRTQLLQDSRIVDALLLAMEDSSTQIRGLTALLLGKVARDDAQDALIRHLGNDPEYGVRMTCSMGLAYTPHTSQKTDAYITALQDFEYQVVVRACNALGKSSDPEAIEPLRAVLTHPTWDVRFRACQALVRLNAVDHGVVSLLETLNQMPEAREYNEIILKAHEPLEGFEPSAGKMRGQAQTTLVVLEQARRLLNG